MEQKITNLIDLLRQHKSAVIAFSGGVDSTFLARIARDAYGDNLLLITATSSTYPYYELDEARSLAELLGIKHRIIVSEEIEIPGYADNPPDRCYYCKSELFGKIKFIAEQEGYEAVFDGSNADDLKDYRPGMRAKQEKGIISPLAETGFTKNDIRHFSALMNLPTATKQSYACLASRFPYGEKITIEKLIFSAYAGRNQVSYLQDQSIGRLRGLPLPSACIFPHFDRSCLLPSEIVVIYAQHFLLRQKKITPDYPLLY